MAHLIFTVEAGVATITLNRPNKMNAFSEEMLDLWIDALQHILHNDTIQVVRLKANGRAFCAGGDLQAMAEEKGFFYSEEDFVSTALARKNALDKKIQQIPLLLEKIDQPVLAEIQGAAFGAGLDMALMCDIRIVAAGAQLSESYINVGIVPGDGGAYYLPRIVGRDQALDLLWNARILTAQQAKEIGLVTFVVEDDELTEFVDHYIDELLNRPSEAIRFIKRAVKKSAYLSLEDSLDLVSSYMGLVTELPAHKEAIVKLQRKLQKKEG